MDGNSLKVPWGDKPTATSTQPRESRLEQPPSDLEVRPARSLLLITVRLGPWTGPLSDHQRLKHPNGIDWE